MDQTFSNLMDIVKRSKSVDGASTRKPPMPKRTIPTPVEEPEEIVTEQEVEDTPSVFGSSKLSSLINRARNSTKMPTTKATPAKVSPKPAEKPDLSTLPNPLPKAEKPKSEPKPKTQPKPQPKPVEKPKTVDKVVEETKDDIIEIAEAPKPKASKPVKRNTDATYESQLYEALQNSLFQSYAIPPE